jgi:hypothetical protein
LTALAAWKSVTGTFSSTLGNANGETTQYAVAIDTTFRESALETKIISSHGAVTTGFANFNNNAGNTRLVATVAYPPGPFTQTMFESVVISDSINKSLTRNLAESVSLTDLLKIGRARFANLVESIVLTDNFSHFFGHLYNLILTETVSLTDTCKKLLNGLMESGQVYGALNSNLTWSKMYKPFAASFGTGMIVDQKGRVLVATDRYLSKWDGISIPYSNGTVSVVNGSAQVTGNNVNWTGSPPARLISMACSTLLLRISPGAY